MHISESNITPFSSSIEAIALPTRFTFPFYYTPHPLCVLAAQELQQHLENQTQWQHDFGLDGSDATGNMFGVLVVQNSQGDLGYLSAFSGILANKMHLPLFVPPVFDTQALTPDMLAQQREIDHLKAEIKVIGSQSHYIELKKQLEITQQTAEQESEAFRLYMIEQRKQRKSHRAVVEKSNDDAFKTQELHRLARESAYDKYQQKEIRQQWALKLSALTEQLQVDDSTIYSLKEKCEQLTTGLQQHYYSQFRFLNQRGEHKNLNDFFEQPPQGAGACASVKLLNHAFKFDLKPLVMAEFWWGASPAAQMRKHKYFYEASRYLCEPILQHMLAGIAIDDNPLSQNPAEGKTLDIVYQDDDMVVINKPAEFLSVPGKVITDSVYTRMQAIFPNSDSPLIVHRLDMSTSGLIVIALTKDAHKSLQKQFINRTVEKRYVALLDGIAKDDHGLIDFPMRVDLEDRPRQLLCHIYGKPAQTTWEVIERKNGRTKVYYYPKTGRTHQLRVHSAHEKGMNMPIIGDDLYGQKSERLCLHAQLLALNHPVTQERMVFEVTEEF